MRRDYLLTLLELVGDEGRPGLASRITNLPGDDKKVVDTRPRIFLADGTPDMNKDRRMLRDYLEEKGFCVVPNRSFYHAPAEFLNDVQELLKSSQLFVQLVGPFSLS